MNCLHSFRTENKLKSHEEVCKNNNICGIAMSSEKDKILEFKQYMKSHKILNIIYTNLECLIEKIDGCVNNPKNSTKTDEHIPCRYSMSKIWLFYHIENKQTFLSLKSFYEKDLYFLGEHAKHITDFEKKKCYL